MTIILARSVPPAPARQPTDDWRLRGACLEMDADFFFPVGTRRAAISQFERAREVCSTCPVRTSCLLFALDVGAEFGMWGGTTPAERQRIKRRAEEAERRRRVSRRAIA